MAGLFAKAAAKKAEAPAKKKSATVWAVGADAKIGVAVHEFVQLEAKKKTIDAQMGLYKTTLKNHGEGLFLRDFAALGVPPETPMKIQNDEGESVTYVVTDRCGSTKVSDEQRDELVQLFGEDGAEKLLFTQTKYEFNPTILAIPGVQDVVEAALGEAIEKLTALRVEGKGKDRVELPPILSEEMAGSLIECNQIRAFRPRTVERLAEICGRSVTLMKDFLSVMGSACTRYVS